MEIITYVILQEFCCYSIFIIKYGVYNNKMFKYRKI